MESKYFWPSISENTFILPSDLPVGNTFPSELWRPCSVAIWFAVVLWEAEGHSDSLSLCVLSRSLSVFLFVLIFWNFIRHGSHPLFGGLCWALSVWKCMLFCSDQFSWFNLIICSASFFTVLFLEILLYWPLEAIFWFSYLPSSF